MPLSFWIFLFVCIVSFIPSALDHGKTWQDYKSSSGNEKIKLGLRLFGLWGIPFLLLIATLLSGYEAKIGSDELNRTQRELTNEMTASGALSNQLQEAKATVSELEARTRRRTITPHQQEILMSLLHPKSDEEIGFMYATGNKEQREYGESLAKIFQDAGFKLNIFTPQDFFAGAYGEGLTCLVRTDKKYPPNAEIIKSAFSAAEISCIWVPDNSFTPSPSALQIWVGKKPTVP